MLRELRIRNLAIVDSLALDLGPGLTVLTGETGAGKSILVDALSLVLGERASTDLIRTGCEEAVVEVAFSPTDTLRRVLAQGQSMEVPEDEDLVVKRVLTRSGKNRSYVGGGLATLGNLQALGDTLVDLHGQHAHQTLLRADAQLALLDAFGDLTGAREVMARQVAASRETKRALAELAEQERERAQQEDIYRYQVQEIEAAALTLGEEHDLRQEERLLANSERIVSLTQEAYEPLYESEPSVLSTLSAIEKALQELATLDPQAQELALLAGQASIHLSELAQSLRDYRAGLAFDPGRMEVVQERLFLLSRLFRKYGEDTEAVLAHAEKARSALARLEDTEAERERLAAQYRDLRKGLTVASQELSQRRRATAKKLEASTVRELKHLGMKRARLFVGFSTEAGEDTEDGCRLFPWGRDRVTFMLAANPGEAPRPLAKVASGGELSRIMLALKTLLVHVDPVPCLIFDEVDAGIGGTVASAVGQRLKALAREHQVLCVTHLPQIACQADSHLRVHKAVEQGRTRAHVERLSPPERVDEIARMLGGERVTPKARQHAEEMLGFT